MRSLSITSSAAISRIRLLTGASPMRSRSSSSMTAPTWLCARMAFTVRAFVASWTAAASLSAGDAASGVGAPGIVYIGAATSGDPARGRDATQLDAHGVDHGFVIRPAEDGAAGDERIGPGFGDAADILRLDAPIDLEPDVAA